MSSADLERHIGRYYGKYPAVVADNVDSNRLGWVKVEIPSVYPNGEIVTARPCFAAGSFWVPPIGAKLWVEFEQGNPARPLWVGQWYATGDVPQEADLDEPTTQVLHTPGGHLVELSDTSGDERITIRNQNDASVVIDADGTITIEAEGGSTRFVLDSAGTVTIDATSVEVNAQSTAISGTAEVGGPVAFEVLLATPDLLAWLQGHTHGSAMGPTSPPIPPIVPTAIKSTKLKAAL